MCGIFGFTGFKSELLDIARNSLHTMNHRGPDHALRVVDATYRTGRGFTISFSQEITNNTIEAKIKNLFFIII